MTKTTDNVRRMVLCAMFTALVAVCSQIAVPMPWGVPINLALFAVYMAGTMLGPVWGTASQVVFIALAAIAAMVVGCAACYLLGTIWFMTLTGADLVSALGWCVLPYLPGDAVKIVLAAMLTIQLDKRLKGSLV